MHDYGCLFWIVVVVGFGAALGLVLKVRENALHKKRDAELDQKAKRLEERNSVFKESFCKGREWLVAMIAEAELAVDSALERQLRTKSHPARKAAKVVGRVKLEKRELVAKLKLLEYQLRTYEEYFPFLEEYREVILDERIPLAGGQDNEAELEAADPTLVYLSSEEYAKLPTSERNQLALDRYLARSKNNWEIGRLYERYLGYLRESSGWLVEYVGAIRGYEDLGRDLICRKGSAIDIVQAKCWSQRKTIHEKHLFQLYGTTYHYRREHPDCSVEAVFVTTTALSEVAREIAEALSIRVESVQLPRAYPMIKCNVNPSTKERIYHLPFDQMYDHTRICREGECFVTTVKEAEGRGFRRAWRWKGGRG